MKRTSRSRAGRRPTHSARILEWTRRPGPGSDAAEQVARAAVQITRQVLALGEAAALLRRGRHLPGLEELDRAVRGIRAAVDAVAQAEIASGADATDTDQELGRVALAVRAVALAQARGRARELRAAIEQELVPALTRLSTTLPELESRLGSRA